MYIENSGYELGQHSEENSSLFAVSSCRCFDYWSSTRQNGFFIWTLKSVYFDGNVLYLYFVMKFEIFIILIMYSPNFTPCSKPWLGKKILQFVTPHSSWYPWSSSDTTVAHINSLFLKELCLLSQLISLEHILPRITYLSSLLSINLILNGTYCPQWKKDFSISDTLNIYFIKNH